MRLAVVTSSLHVLGQTSFGFNLSIAQILLTLTTCAAIELAVNFRRQKAVVWPTSALLTGNSIALILRSPGTEHGDWWSLRGWWVFVLAAVLGITSKYVIRWKGSHIFNPSNLALVVVFVALGENLADPQILWWGDWSISLGLGLLVIVGGSIAVTAKVKHLRTAIAFWIPYSILITALVLADHAITTNWYVGPLQGWPLWTTLTLSPEVLVFVFYMISDPKASAHTSEGKVVFGLLIAVFSALLVAVQVDEFGTKVAILAGLVLACPFVPFIDNRVLARKRAIRGEHRSRLHRRQTVVRTMSLTAVTAGVMPLVFFLGSTVTSEPNQSGDPDVLARRSEVAVHDLRLPEINLDEAVGRSMFTLDEETARKMGTDAVHDLMIEARALAEMDADLLAAASTGTRLALGGRLIHSNSSIDENLSSDVLTYGFNSITVSIFKRDDGPQTSPELAVHLTGVIVANGETQSLDSTYTVVEQGGHYLLANEYDQERNPLAHPFETILGGNGTFTPERPVEPPLHRRPDLADGSDMSGLVLIDRAEELGLVLPHSRFDLGEAQGPTIGGAAVGDFDNDGWPDIYLTRVGFPNVLYRNVEGTFIDVTHEAGLAAELNGAALRSDQAAPGGSTAAMFIDLDGDGNLDLISLGVEGRESHVYINDGNGHFTDATTEWNFPRLNRSTRGSFYIGLAASDFDHDGRVDVLVLASEPESIEQTLMDAGITGSSMCSSEAKAIREEVPPVESSTVLLRNTEHGFEDVTPHLGVEPAHIAASSARFVDLDGDTWDDLVIGGSMCTSKVLMNQEGVFIDKTASSGIDSLGVVNGVEVLDTNGDGGADLFTTGASYPTESGNCPFDVLITDCAGNALLLNDGSGSFTMSDTAWGISDSYWAWGASAVDLVNRSGLDIFVSNGLDTALSPALGSDHPVWGLLNRSEGTPNEIFTSRSIDRWTWVQTIDDRGFGSSWNSTDGSRDQGRGSATVSMHRPSLLDNGRAVIPADFNRDGRIDLLVINNHGHPALLMNETENDNHWTIISLRDQTSANSFGIGARVSVRTPDGRSQVRRIGTEGSYQAGLPPMVHFGLGSVRSISEVTIEWPDGTVTTVAEPPMDEELTVDHTGGLR